MLVGLHCLSEFGAFSMLRFATFTTAIYDQYSSSFASAAANMLAVVLVACCLILVTSESWLSGRARRARLGSGAARLASAGRGVLGCGCADLLRITGGGWSHSEVRAAVLATRRKTLADSMARADCLINSML